MAWFADNEPAQFEAARDNEKVSLWPFKGAARNDPRFRLINGEGIPAPRADRYFVRFLIEDGPPTVYKNCVIPLFPIGDQELEGTSGVSTDGYEFILRIKSWTTPDPEFGVFGWETHITYKHAGFPDFFVRQMTGTDVPANRFLLKLQVRRPLWFQTLGPFWYSSNYDPLVNTDVDVFDMPRAWFHWPLSECLNIPPDPVGGFAEFNGVDSYIANASPTIDTTGAWRMQFDVRLHQTDENMLLCKSFNTTRWTKIRTVDLNYNSRVIVFSTPLNLNQWYHIDWRYQWDGADGLYRVSVDGGPDDTVAGSGVNLRWDRYSKRGTQAPIGHYDLKNLLFENGTAVSSVVYLDQKLQANACDDGPDGRDGETFNMALPSCPP